MTMHNQPVPKTHGFAAFSSAFSWWFVMATRGRYGWMVARGCVAVREQAAGPWIMPFLEEVRVASVIAFDVNETLLDLRALDEPFEVLLGSAALRPLWFTLMLQLAFTGGLTGQYVDFTTA